MQRGTAFIKGKINFLKNYLDSKIDPVLLTFLLLLLNYRLSFKILALTAIFILRPHFRLQRNGVTLFYASMIALGLTNFALSADYSYQHSVIVLTGCATWLACLLTFHQLKLSVEACSIVKLTNTLKSLAIINLIASLIDFTKIVFVTHALNPYTQLLPPPYGISSGDFIGGVFGGLHLVNTIICSLLMIFFIYQNSATYTLICLLPFLLTGSNLGTIILTAVLLGVIFLKKGVVLKTIAVICIAFTCLFYIRITPENQRYMANVVSKILRQVTHKAISHEHITNQVSLHKGNQATITSFRTKEKKRVHTKEELISMYIWYKQKKQNAAKPINTVLADVNVLKAINTYEAKIKELELKKNKDIIDLKDSLVKAKSASSFFEYGKLKKFDLDGKSGKLISFEQTVNFLSSSPTRALLGGGIGSFSSRLAFITSGIVDDSRILLALPFYETPEFVQNHKALFKYLMYCYDETHSITNLPFCWYNEVFGEYGIVGFLLFLLFYCGYFARKAQWFSLGFMLLAAMLGFFFFDYWFERLSVVVIFELLMLLFIKMKEQKEVV
jgi:hypothetical protein